MLPQHLGNLVAQRGLGIHLPVLMALQIMVVVVGQGRWHQHLHVLAHNFSAAPAENGFCSGVVFLHIALGVNADDAVCSHLHQGAQAGLVHVHFLPAGAIVQQPIGLGDEAANAQCHQRNYQRQNQLIVIVDRASAMA